MIEAVKKQTFEWRRYIPLVIALIIVGKVLWQFPRRNWLPKKTGQTTSVVPGGAETGRASKGVQHIVLISIDTCRADHLGCYGYSRDTSPNIDTLAATSIVFNHAVSPVPMTLPSHCSMLTGTTPPYHEVRDNIGYRLGEANVTLAETLREEGFATGAVVASYVLDSDFGMDQGFDTYEDRIYKGDGMSRLGNERKAERVTKLAELWLEKHRREKFFLFVHYYDPHTPHEFHEQFPFTSWPFISTGKDRYDSEIAYTDHWIGKVIDKLKQLGLYDSTLIILTGDHGEALMEHGESTHSYFIYHSNIHVPLMFKLPGSAVASRIYDVAGLVDIVPTVCGMLGIDAPVGVEGQDLSIYFCPEPPSGRDNQLYCESLTATTYGAESLAGVVTNRYKYIQTTRPELYDLFEDPREKDNVIKEQSQRAQTLRDSLMAMLIKENDSDSDGRMSLDAESLKRLHSLGYVGGGITDNSDLGQSRDDPKDLVGFHNSYKELIDLVYTEKYGQAKKLARKLIERLPRFHGNIMTSLAQVLATHPDEHVRDADTAVFIAEHGANLSEYKEVLFLDVLAMAYAVAGRFERAVRTAEMAIELAVEEDSNAQADDIGRRLKLYEHQRPFIRTKEYFSQ